MPLTVTLPNISSPATTKDQIISILSNLWPLSAKSIHTTIKREFGSEASYQAVHKALKDLQKDKVVATEGKDYKLNSEWLKNIKSFSDRVIENYEN